MDGVFDKSYEQNEKESQVIGKYYLRTQIIGKYKRILLIPLRFLINPIFLFFVLLF